MGNIVLFGFFTENLQEIFHLLTARGEEVFWETREKAFINLLGKTQPFLVVTDRSSSGKNCMEVLHIVQSQAPKAKLIVLTGDGNCSPVETKDTETTLLPCSVQHASPSNFLKTVGKLSLMDWGDLLKGEIPLFPGGFSEEMKRLEAMAHQIADTDATVLIQGESGVGKGVLASYLHYNSKRKDCPFVKVNCAALPSELLESELFGYERGAFTGANGSKPGKFESAKNGTILLDEIGELSLPMQAKLLHVLEDKKYARLGAQQDIQIHARVLVATNRDLEVAVLKEQFRKDLYYRLQVVQLVIPPLRKRRQEIPLFINYFLDKFSRQFDRPKFSLSSDELQMLVNHDWPGNVRQLENLMKRLILFQDRSLFPSEMTAAEELGRGKTVSDSVPAGLREATKRVCRETERNLILKTLEHTHWNRTVTAKILKVSYKTLLNKMQEYGLQEVSEVFQERGLRQKVFDK